MPYVIAAAVIAFISRQYSLRSIWAEMAKGQALPLFPLALATYFASLAWVAAADRTVLRGLLPEELTPTYFAIAKGKAAAVVLHIVHYALGQGIYATWVARRTRLNVGQAGGLIFYIILGELGSVCLYAALVIGIGRPAVPGSVLPVVLGETLLGVVTRAELALAMQRGRAHEPVAAIASKAWVEVELGTPVETVIESMDGARAVMAVVHDDGVPVGVITRDHLHSAVLLSSLAGPPKTVAPGAPSEVAPRDRTEW